MYFVLLESSTDNFYLLYPQYIVYLLVILTYELPDETTRLIV